MKKLFIFILAITLLCGCSLRPQTYQFPNSLDEVVSVELIHIRPGSTFDTDPAYYDIVKALDAQEIRSFMNEAYLLETKKNGTPPPMGYGEYVARVSYKNGDIEMLGMYQIEYIPVGDKANGVGDYYFSGDTFEELFLKYAEIED